MAGKMRGLLIGMMTTPGTGCEEQNTAGSFPIETPLTSTRHPDRAEVQAKDSESVSSR
jgi:hypothetical protein